MTRRIIVCFVVACLLSYAYATFVLWDWFWLSDISDWKKESRFGFLSYLTILGLLSVGAAKAVDEMRK